ncbi:hypothetical protein ACFO5K_18775 [Nocardia halotolerans]|uniref:PRC-barrel domain-containing protein n=1 Tax=Nocardia halotolerans TaxID=1755878 RepID=A0ABV8VNA0_9NOCA
MNDWHGHHALDVDAELLDRQVMGPDGAAVGKVDDLTLVRAEDGTLEIGDLVIGAAALLGQLPALARWPLRWCLDLTGSTEPRHVPIDEVREVNSAVEITAAAQQRAESPAGRRVRDRLIARIPGADDAG